MCNMKLFSTQETARFLGQRVDGLINSVRVRDMTFQKQIQCKWKIIFAAENSLNNLTSTFLREMVFDFLKYEKCFF